MAHRFEKIEALPGPTQAYATKLLEKLARMCNKVMERRSWHIPRLAELDPRETSKHGHNGFEIRGGVYYSMEIVIKLRHAPPHSDSFYDWDYLVSTLGHELAHCTHDNHSAEFYALMDTIIEELYKDAVSISTETSSGSATFSGKSITLGTLSLIHDLCMILYYPNPHTHIPIPQQRKVGSGWQFMKHEQLAHMLR